MNEEKFSGKAAVYAKFRPTYPDAFISYLYSDVGFQTSSVIADIGAGTGIFSKLLASKSRAVLCVEPNSDMLETARRELAGYPNCALVKATAENTTLDNHSVDFVTVAQAFHWFDRSRFKAECKRILRSRGKVVLVWNTRDSADSLTIETASINQEFCPDFQGFSRGSEASPSAYADFFKDGCCEHKVFRNSLVFNEAEFIGRNLSGSYAPQESSSYDAYVREIRGLFQRHSKDGTLTVPNITRSYAGEV